MGELNSRIERPRRSSGALELRRAKDLRLLQSVTRFLAAIGFGLASMPFSLWALHPYSSIVEALKVGSLELAFASVLALAVSSAIWWRLRHGSSINEEKQKFIDAMSDDDGVS